MKKEFSTHWKSSKQPRKQRKYLANAPLHVKRKFLSSNLSKELREKHKMRSISLRKDDVVKVMRGKFNGKQGKILEVIPKYGKVIVEGIQVKKADGSKSNVRLQPSNLKVMELNLTDKKRFKNSELSEGKKPLKETSQPSKESKPNKEKK